MSQRSGTHLISIGGRHSTHHSSKSKINIMEFEDEEGLEFKDEETFKPVLRGYQRRRLSVPVCACFFISICTLICLLVFIIALGAALPLTIGVLNRGSSTLFYSSGDTRTVSYDVVFCDLITLTVPSSDLKVSLNAVTRRPSLTETSIFNFTKEGNIPAGKFQEWHFHLHPGSFVSTILRSPCNTEDATLLILKGTDNFQQWRIGRGFKAFQSWSLCKQNSMNLTSIRMQEEDDYYIIIHTSSTAVQSTDYNVTFIINRIQYGTESTDFSCTATGGSPCQIANHPNRWYILKLEESNQPQTLYYDLSINCTHRIITFVLIPVVPALLLLLAVFLLSISCYIIYKKDSKEAQMLNDSIGSHTSKETFIKYSINKPKQGPLVGLSNPVGIGKAHS